MEEDRSAFSILTGTPTGKRLVVNERTMLEWTLKNRRQYKAQDRDYWTALVNVTLNLWVP